jgi:hypothetical protein
LHVATELILKLLDLNFRYMLCNVMPYINTKSVIANALATRYGYCFSNIPGMDPILQNVPEKLCPCDFISNNIALGYFSSTAARAVSSHGCKQILKGLHGVENHIIVFGVIAASNCACDFKIGIDRGRYF